MRSCLFLLFILVSFRTDSFLLRSRRKTRTRKTFTGFQVAKDDNNLESEFFSDYLNKELPYFNSIRPPSYPIPDLIFQK